MLMVAACVRWAQAAGAVISTAPDTRFHSRPPYVIVLRRKADGLTMPCRTDRPVLSRSSTAEASGRQSTQLDQDVSSDSTVSKVLEHIGDSVSAVEERP